MNETPTPRPETKESLQSACEEVINSPDYAWLDIKVFTTFVSSLAKLTCEKGTEDGEARQFDGSFKSNGKDVAVRFIEPTGRIEHTPCIHEINVSDSGVVIEDIYLSSSFQPQRPRYTLVLKKSTFFPGVNTFPRDGLKGEPLHTACKNVWEMYLDSQKQKQ